MTREQRHQILNELNQRFTQRTTRQINWACAEKDEDAAKKCKRIDAERLREKRQQGRIVDGIILPL